MSHYTVAVISKDLGEVEKLLYPHGKYNLGEKRRVTYSKEEVIERARRGLEEFNKHIYSRYIIDEEKFINQYKYFPKFIEYVKYQFPEEYKAGDEKLYDDIARKELQVSLEEDGSVSLDYDPDKKYEYYSMTKGPKNTLFFKNEDGGIREDFRGRVKDLIVDKEPAREEAEKLRTYWDRTIKWKMDYLNDDEDSCLPAELRKYYEEKDNKRKYLLDTYVCFENFLKENTILHTSAVVTPDGRWHESSIRNWFGSVSFDIYEGNKWAEGYYDTFLKPYQDCYITFLVFTDH